MGTNLVELLPELAGGTLERQVGAALDDVASHVVTLGKKGRVQLTFDLEQIGNSHQVKLSHQLKITTPKKRGKVVEEQNGDTALVVGSGGKLSLFPDVPTGAPARSAPTLVEG